MEGQGKTLRAVGFSSLVLAATIAVPAFSAAQDSGPAEPAPPPPPPAQADPPPPPGPADPATEPVPSEDEAVPAEPESSPDSAATAVAAAEPAVASSAADAKAKASAASVSVGDNFYSPTTVSVFEGETVTWRNNGQAQHSATANDGSFDTGIFGPGASRSETFSSAGTFSYYCTVHGLSQSGTVRVSAAGGGGGGGGGSAAANATSGTSEAAAVTSGDAAGTSTSLPATGFAVLGLGGTGLILLASGMAVERRATGRRRRSRPF